MLTTNSDMTAFLPETLVQHSASQRARRARLSIFYLSAALLSLFVAGFFGFSLSAFACPVCVAAMLQLSVSVSRTCNALKHTIFVNFHWNFHIICQFGRSVVSFGACAPTRSHQKFAVCTAREYFQYIHTKICMRATRPVVRGRLLLSGL